MVLMRWATYVLQWEVNNKKQCFCKANLEKPLLKFKLFSETRKYEGGIASNRVSIASR